MTRYPIQQNKFFNVAAFVATPEKEGTVYDGEWVATGTTEEVVEAFKEWDPEVPKFLQVRSHKHFHLLCTTFTRHILAAPPDAATLGGPQGPAPAHVRQGQSRPCRRRGAWLPSEFPERWS